MKKYTTLNNLFNLFITIIYFVYIFVHFEIKNWKINRKVSKYIDGTIGRKRKPSR